MKFSLKNLIFFGIFFLFVFLLLSAIFVYISPSSANLDEIFIGLSVNAWKTQFVISFMLFIVFIILFIFTTKWDSLKKIIKSEYPGMVWKSTEFWTSLALVFVLVSLSGSDIGLFRKIAGTYNEGGSSSYNDDSSQNSAKSFSGNDLRQVALADLTIEQVAANYQRMNEEIALSKLQRGGINCPPEATTIGAIADLNGLPVNEIIREIGDGELLSQYIRNGKQIKDRTIADAEKETGIPSKHILKILDSYDVIHTDDLQQTFDDLANTNGINADDIYRLLTSSETKQLPRKAKGNKLREFINVARNMSVPEVCKVIKEQQPNAEISDEIAFERLNKNKINTSKKDATISQIAKENNVEIDEILKIISFGTRENPNEESLFQKVDGPPQKSKNKDNSKALELVQTPLSILSFKFNLKTDDMIKALSNKGITAKSSETIEEIAKNNNQKPGPIVKILRELKPKKKK